MDTGASAEDDPPALEEVTDRVAADMAVAVSYQLYDQSGALVGEVLAADPLRYLHGYAQILPALEAGLSGAKQGETRAIEAPPDVAFGVRDDSAEMEIDRQDLPESDAVQVGDELLATGPDGDEAVYRVVRLTAESIFADLNHPLAGQTVRFVATVVELRAASDEELDVAYHDFDEHIVYDSTIVYGSGLGSPVEGSVVITMPAASAPSELVQLRRPQPRKDADNHE